MPTQKLVLDLNGKARAVLINGRPFIKKTSLGEWMGFRWGKAEISIRSESPYFPDDKWRTRFYTKEDAWDLRGNWGVEILRNINAALDEKLKDQEKRRMEEEEKVRQAKANLNSTQKFYGDLVLKELAR